MQASQIIEIGAFYQHYKGNFYKVLNIAHYSEDPSQKFVVYQALYHSPDFGNNSVWVRPYNMFAESIIIDGNSIQRFKKVDHIDNNASK